MYTLYWFGMPFAFPSAFLRYVVTCGGRKGEWVGLRAGVWVGG